MMKLFAFRDRIDDENKEFGRYHVLDLYSILATTTEEEWKYTMKLQEKYKNSSYVLEVAKLVNKYFSSYSKYFQLILFTPSPKGIRGEFISASLIHGPCGCFIDQNNEIIN